MDAEVCRRDIADDEDCGRCGETARERVCSACGVTARICDCGCMRQPRPIAAGRINAEGFATDLHRDFCERCADDRSDQDVT